MNVNEEMMRFPFMNFHSRTCIITGTSTVVFLIEALIECSKNKTLITPGLILQKCLNSKNFKLPDSIKDGVRDIERFNSTDLFADDYELDLLYSRWMNDLPKKKEEEPVFNNISMDLYDPTVDDYKQQSLQVQSGITQEEEEETLRNYGSIPPVDPQDSTPQWTQEPNTWRDGIPVQDSNGDWHMI
jgi:hypothetical protein